MMTEPAPLTAPPEAAPVRPAPLSHTSAITTFGTLTWLGWAWAIAVVVYVAILVIAGGDADRDQTLWAPAAADWQRYTMFAAGVTMTPVFAPMLIANGITRAQLFRSIAVAAGVLAGLGGLLITAGFALEHVVYEWQDWPHRLVDGRVVDWGTVPQLGLAYAVTLAGHCCAGWLVGIGWQRARWPGVAALAAPAAVPVLVTEGLVMGDDLDGRPSWIAGVADVPFAVGVVVALVAIAGAVALARRLTRDVAVW
jgi:hypothetical protein